MIYITGDMHGDPSRLSSHIFPEQKEMTRDDYVIVCGDFGLVWDRKETPQEKYWLDWLEERPFTTLFVDGNHENHARLMTFPEEEWHGGQIHRIRPHVLHLMRGQYFEDVDGRTVFAFGGARSHDIWNLFDPKDEQYKEQVRRARRNNEFFRVVGESWWPEEMPSSAEMQTGRDNLAKHGWNVDFIVTHAAASSTVAMFSSGRFKPDELTAYLQEISERTRYTRWFFGHYHDNRQVTGRDILIYEQIIRIG